MASPQGQPQPSSAPNPFAQSQPTSPQSATASVPQILEALGNMVMQGQEQNRSFMGLFQSMSIEQQRQSEELKEAVTHLGSRKEAPTGWTKFIPRPDPFKPKDREEELTQWQDWSWSFKQWILAISPEMYTAIEEVEQDLSSPCEEATMTDDAILQGKQLYAILTSMLRERPLQILKSVTGANGFETWRVLNNVLAPTNKTRALALLGAISQFPAMNQGNLLEQVLRLEDLFRKYEQASGKPVPNEMQSAILLRVLPQQVRSHLTITIGDDSTYESMRDMILRWERSTQKWSSQIVTGGAPQKPSYDDPNGPSPMDVDRVKGWPKGKGKWGKGAGKGSGKDGGKYGGKNGKGKGGKGGYESRPGKGKGYEKGGKGKQSSWGRNDWSKGGKDRGKKGGKGKERLSHDACRICGKSGHWGNECWMKDKVRNINQNDTSSASGNSSSASSSNSSTGTASVKRVFDLADSDRLDVPMTTVYEMDSEGSESYVSDNESWWCRVIEHSMVDGEDELEVIDFAWETYSVMDMSLDDALLGDEEWVAHAEVRGISSRSDEGYNALSEGLPQEVVLDSGADLSVMPRAWLEANLGDRVRVHQSEWSTPKGKR